MIDNGHVEPFFTIFIIIVSGIIVSGIIDNGQGEHLFTIFMIIISGNNVCDPDQFLQCLLLLYVVKIHDVQMDQYLQFCKFYYYCICDMIDNDQDCSIFTKFIILCGMIDDSSAESILANIIIIVDGIEAYGHSRQVLSKFIIVNLILMCFVLLDTYLQKFL